jgi:hypothetical protein
LSRSARWRWLDWLNAEDCAPPPTVAPASPSARAMPRPAPRVAPATSATRPAKGLEPAGAFFLAIFADVMRA